MDKKDFQDRLERRNQALRLAGLPPCTRLDPSVPLPTAGAPSAIGLSFMQNCLALIATRNFLPYARITARTFLDHHPDFSAVLLLVDGEPADKALFQEGAVILLDELGLRDAGWYCAKLTAAEFSNALKPALLRYLADFVDTIIYLDCDIAVFDRFVELVESLGQSDLVLVPHMLRPFGRPERFGTHPTRADIFNSGLINAGCFGIRPGRCQEFLHFWEEANLGPGAFFAGAGYQTDQQHLNWALIMVSGVSILRSSRYNVAYWNLHDRDLRQVSHDVAAQRFEVDGKPLAFFHFSGYDINEPLKLSRHDQRHSVYDLPSVAALVSWYAAEILGSPQAGLLDECYRFDRLANGFQLTHFIRERLKKYEVYIARCDTRSPAGADALCAVLMDPLPATGSLLPLIAAEIYDERPDLQSAFPGAHTAHAPEEFWRWFCRHAGREYQIQPLIDNFRRVLLSDSLSGFAEQVARFVAPLKFLGPDRVKAADRLRLHSREDLAEVLLEARTEWSFFTDISAALHIYSRRSDLHEAFPDVFEKNHEAFVKWLARDAPKEHGCPPDLHARFQRHASGRTLGRVFSYLARREDLSALCEASLLSDDPAPILRELIRGSGEGLEYDLEDVVVFRFLHATKRHLLVPLFLELPSVRRRAEASRVAGKNLTALPAEFRALEWARRGCAVHAAHYEPLEAMLDDEMRYWAQVMQFPSRDVLGLIGAQQGRESSLKMAEVALRKAARRLPHGDAAYARAQQKLPERKEKPGVNLFGYFYSDIGVGESSRGLARALEMLRPLNQVPFCTAQISDGTTLPDLFQQFDYLTDTNVFVSYPHQREDLIGMMRLEQTAGRRNIVHLAWEQKDGNPWWKVVYDRYDEIWAISEFAAVPFRRMFPGRVRVVPNVLSFETFPACDQAIRDRLTGETVKFLFVFDANSSIERKNPEGVIDAFTAAFKGTLHADRVQLTLKVGGMQRPEHSARIHALMTRAARSGLTIHFDGRQLSREALLEMIASADCYVSLHRAEGFGYTMAEAMFYGLPVIASGYSGNLEYMNGDNSYLVPCKEAFVKTPDGPFQRGSVWGDPDLDAAVDMLRQVAEHPADAIARGRLGHDSVVGRLSASAVAAVLRPCFESCIGNAEQLAAE